MPDFFPGQTLSASQLQQLGFDSTYTPALHGSTTNPTLGSGGQGLGWYNTNGRCVDLWFQIAFGSSGVNPGSGIYTVTYPPGLSPRGGFPNLSIGTCRLIDSSGATETTAQISLTSGAMFPTLTGDPALFVLDNRPWVWAAGDSLGGHVTYLTA
jgi:hypothetical protein